MNKAYLSTWMFLKLSVKFQTFSVYFLNLFVVLKVPYNIFIANRIIFNNSNLLFPVYDFVSNNLLKSYYFYLFMYVFLDVLYRQSYLKIILLFLSSLYPSFVLFLSLEGVILIFYHYIGYLLQVFNGLKAFSSSFTQLTFKNYESGIAFSVSIVW